MKKRTITLLAYGLALMFLMYNCKKKDVEDPLAPDPSLVDKINKIEVATVTLVAPKPVVFTESKYEASTAAAGVASSISNIGTGGVTDNVKAVGTTISTAFTPQEAATLSSVSAETLATIKAGGAIPADLRAILTKAAANPAVAAYFSKVTLPTVEGKEITGLRTSAGEPESVEQVEGILVSDVCLAAAEAEYQKVKVKLDASRTTQLAAVAAQYSSDIAPLAAAEASCLSALPTKYDALRAAETTTFTSINALLDANQGAIGAELYVQLKAYVYLVYIANLTSLNDLQAADTKACTAKTEAATANAEAARDANALAVEAAYKTADAAALAARAELAESCHNQGGGQ